MIWGWLDGKRIQFSWPFAFPDASRDRCQLPGCWVMRKLHGRAHAFVEHESKIKEK